MISKDVEFSNSITMITFMWQFGMGPGLQIYGEPGSLSYYFKM